MFEKRVRQDFKGNHATYTQFLVKQIGTTWRGEASEWISCPSPASDLLSIQELPDLMTFTKVGGI